MRSPTVTPPLPRRAAQAAPDPDRVCTTLASLSETDVLREASHHTSTSSAAGIAGVTAQPSAAPLDEHRRAVHERRRHGCDQAAPVARVWSAKDDGVSVRSGRRRSRTRWSSERWPGCWKRSTRTTSPTARRAVGQDGAPPRHGRSDASGACMRGWAGSWRQRCVETATVLPGRDGGTCSANGSMMDGACASWGHGSVPG